MKQTIEHPIQDTLLDIFQAMPGDPQSVIFHFEAQDITLTRADFTNRVRRMATGLKSLGVEPGDRVAVILDNGPAIVEVWFATFALGAIWVPVNTALRGQFLLHVLNDADAKVVVAESSVLPDLAAIDGDLHGVECVVWSDDMEGKPPAGGCGNRRLVDIAELRRAEPLRDFYPARPADTCCLIYTSGTTGPSKGCMLPHNYLTNLSRSATFGRRAEDPVYTTLPLYHLNAMTSVIITMMVASRATIGRRFSVSGFWPSIEASGARFVNLLGPMAAMIANAPDSDAMIRCKGQLRRVLSAPFPRDVQEIFRTRFGVAEVFGVGYGMTEAAPITNAAPDHIKQPAGSSGVRTHLMQVQIFDDDDNELPSGQIGEVVCRPNYPNIMFSGYWRRPEDTVKAWRNLWFHTGDLGYFDQDGFFFFVDRKKDYIRRRGENISSMEVENVFLRHSAVAEVAAYGVPSDMGEDEVQISVVLRDGAVLTEQELCEWSVAELPYFAVPRFIEFRDSLPKSVVGRSRKVDLRNRPPGYPRWDREQSSIDLKRRR